MGVRRIGLGVVLLWAVGLLCSVPPAGAADGPPGRNGLLAYVVDGDIWTARPDGTQRRQLTDTGTDSDPTWSPDGRSVAFVSTRAGNADIFVMGADGAGVRRLTTSLRQDLQPAWSPTGTRLAFIRTHQADTTGTGTFEQRSQLYVMSANGSGQRLLHANPLGFDRDPGWSPNGQAVAFSTIANPQTQFYVVGIARLDGTSPAVEQAPGENFDPDWTSTGAAIAYHSTAGHDEFGDVWRSAQPAGPSTDLTDLAGREWAPSWAPAGGRLAFIHRDLPDGTATELWVRDSSGMSRSLVAVADVAPLPGAVGVFSWSPNAGSLVAATPSGLVVAAADGSWIRSLGIAGTDPDWQRVTG